MHEKERVRDAALLGEVNYLAAQEPEQAHHEEVHAECGRMGRRVAL